MNALMKNKQSNEKFTVIVGLGQTGFSCAKFLAKRQQSFVVIDSREMPPYLLAFKQLFPDVLVSLGEWNEALINQADELIISPGVALTEPFIQRAIANGVSVISDLDLFCENISAPIVAITGSNGKSTVTELLGEMAKAAEKNVGVGGNIGIPVLDMSDDHDLYVLELSSFQLESAHSLRPNVALLLNISPDHLDRYDDLLQYQQAKQRIFHDCDYAIFNREDALTNPMIKPKKAAISFGLDYPKADSFGLITENDTSWIAYSDQKLLAIDELKLRGMHNVANVLAALSVGYLLNFPMQVMLEVLKSFTGLAHRCQWIASINSIEFINDSKGTNVGATVAAIEGFSSTLQGKIVLILGGETKDQDFYPLISPVEKYVRHVVLLGKNTHEIEQVLGDSIACSRVLTMHEAVFSAFDVAIPGDCVLLSPACASFDLFKDYKDRGCQFISAVGELQLAYENNDD